MYIYELEGFLIYGDFNEEYHYEYVAHEKSSLKKSLKKCAVKD